MKKIREGFNVIARDRILRVGIPAYLISVWLLWRNSDGWVWFWCWFVDQIVTCGSLFLLFRRGRQRRAEMKQRREGMDHWEREVMEAGCLIAACVAAGDLYAAQQNLPRHNEALARWGRECETARQKFMSWL